MTEVKPFHPRARSVQKKPAPMRMNWVEKTILTLGILSTLGVIGGGWWLAGVLDHTRFQTIGPVGTPAHLALPSARASQMSAPPVVRLQATPVVTPPAATLYASAQSAYDAGNPAGALENLDRIVSAYPALPEIDTVHSAIRMSQKLMQDNASGLHATRLPLWHYRDNGADRFAFIESQPDAAPPPVTHLPPLFPLPATVQTAMVPEEGGDSDASPSSRHALGVIASKVGEGSLYGVALYGQFGERWQECATHPCTLSLTLDNQTLDASVTYQRGANGGALKFSDAVEATTFINALPTTATVGVDFEGTTETFHPASLRWEKLGVTPDQIGAVHQDAALLPETPPAILTIDPHPPGEMSVAHAPLPGMSPGTAEIHSEPSPPDDGTGNHIEMVSRP
jgi:hypothetical protein